MMTVLSGALTRHATRKQAQTALTRLDKQLTGAAAISGTRGMAK
jgi:hypothetical protein